MRRHQFLELILPPPSPPWHPKRWPLSAFPLCGPTLGMLLGARKGGATGIVSCITQCSTGRSSFSNDFPGLRAFQTPDPGTTPMFPVPARFKDEAVLKGGHCEGGALVAAPQHLCEDLHLWAICERTHLSQVRSLAQLALNMSMAAMPTWQAGKSPGAGGRHTQGGRWACGLPHIH